MDDPRDIYKIRGVVTGRDSQPMRGARVAIWWQHIRNRSELAFGETSERGHYEISYKVPPNEHLPVLLVVEAVSEFLDTPLLSPQTPAQPDLEIDLHYQSPDQSQWTNQVRLIEPLLDGLSLSEIVENSTHQDLSFLAQELGQSAENLMQVAVAARMEAAFSVAAPVFYAFLYQQTPSSLPTPLLDASQDFTLIDALVQNLGSLIFALSADVQQGTLISAVALDLIDPRFTERIPEIVKHLQALRVTDMLNQPYLVGSTTLSQILGAAAVPAAQQQAFSQALATNTQPMRNFWRTLGDGQHGFTAAEASSIERALSIGAFVKNYVPLIDNFIQEFNSGTYKSLSDLARLSLQDWIQMVTKTGPPPGIDAAGTLTPVEVFASVVYTRVTRAFPTAALSNRIASGNLVAQGQQQPLQQFFQNNPDLELIKYNISVYLAAQGTGAFKGINQADQPAVIANLRVFQRVLRVAPNMDAAQALLGIGIQSATQIATIGQQQFFIKATAAGLTRKEATQVYYAAAQRYANVVSLYMKLNFNATGVLPTMVGNVNDMVPPVQQAIQSDPSLATLFGSVDYCEVDDCTTVLSPAAYLCDLLLWLRNHPQGAQTALDVLDARRPDIRNLLLNCPNTDTELPYIDLVNELLSDMVSPPTDPSSNINPIWKQTSYGLTSEQLSAAPEYFNQPAFVTLFSAVYPQSLPYSTGLDELRTYLQQWNLPLWQLRQALLPLSGATVDQQAAVTAERLGMNVIAENLVTQSNTTPAFLATVWNTADFSSTGLAAVPAFLQAASLTYESLLELLQVTWVQGGLNIAIGGINDSCQTETQALTPSPLDPGFLDRAQRFLRLWLTTGYKMWELDLLLNAPSIGNGTLDENALIALQAFWQLQNVTGLAVNQLLAFYQNIDTGTHRDPDGSTTTPLYAQVYLNPTVTWVAPDPDLVNLPAGGAIGDTVMSDHLKALQPALGVSGADAATLFGLTDNTLTLDNLSLIYRVSALAQASKFSIANLLAVATLLNPAAASQSAAVATFFASPAATLAFLAQLKNLRQSGLSLDALTYLLTPPVISPVTTTTTLTAAITNSQTTITVAGDTGFPTPNFSIAIGAEILLVTGVGGVGNTTWTVLRGQQGTTAASASIGAAVTPAGNGGWATTTQMTPASIAAALGTVQLAIIKLLSAGTTLAAAIGATDTTITVASDAGFPTAAFYVYIGSEIVQVTATSGTGNTTWTVLRGQQGTTAVAATVGASVTPTSGDMDGAVIAAVAANAYPTGASPLANDVTALILETVDLPGAGKSLLSVLEEPSLVAPTGTITIAGTPVAGDILTTVLTALNGTTATVSYTLAPADAGDVNQTAFHFALAINASTAVAGPNAFLATCTPSGAVITLTGLTPGAPGSNVTCTNAAQPGSAGHASVTPQLTVLNGVPAATQANFLAQFMAIQLFDKIAVLVRGLRLVSTDLGWLLANAAVYGGLDLTQLPVAPVQPPLNLTLLLTTLLTIKLARTFIASLPSSAVQTLYDVISGVSSATLATEAQAQNALATVSGWPLADIEAFAPALGLVYPASYTQPSVYDALRTLEAMSQKVTASGPVSTTASTTVAAAINNTQTTITVASAIGFPAPNFYINIGAEILLVTVVGGTDNTSWTVLRGQQGTTAAAAASGATVTPTNGAQIVSWGSVPADEISAESMAASALGVLKAQQVTEGAWLALAPTLMNPIRERRSAALQAYLTGQRDGSGNLIYQDVNKLFDYFLIDVQMSSCMLTSRIVQAYIAVQIFVERCFMNLETTLWNSTASGVIVNQDTDDTWSQWEWMKRYRIWEANREVFLYPENWLIESQRPNRTEIYQKLEQEVHQGDSTTDYLQTVVLNYIDRLDGLAHLHVTGTCEDPQTQTIYVVARTLADPPVFYIRSYANGAWSGWTQIPLDIKAHQAIPAMYRGRVCIFWLDIKATNEPKQTTTSPQASSSPPSGNVNRYMAIGVNFSVFRNGSWTPAQSAKGKLFDKPIFDSTAQAGDSKSIESLYTLKVQMQTPTPGLGAALFLDVFRLGTFNVKNMYNEPNDPLNYQVTGGSQSIAVHLGRAVFDGRFSDLELNNFIVPGVYPDDFQSGVNYAFGVPLLLHSKSTYGPDAQPLIPLTGADPNLTGESGMLPIAGALTAFPNSTSAGQAIQLNFPAVAYEQNYGPLVTVPLPMRVVGPCTDLNLNPTSYFFLQDTRRSYFVETPKYYWTGSFFSPAVPSDPSSVPYEVLYQFHPFYHAFTRLAWNQLGAGGFDLLYDPDFQQAPDSVDPSYTDVFSFQNGYQPTSRVEWDLADAATTLAAGISSSQTEITVANNIWVPLPAFYVYIGSELLQVTAVSGTNRTLWTVNRGQSGTTAAAAAAGAQVTPKSTSQDRQFLDFTASGTFSVYNWELFYHIPLYIAQLLSQNQQFEDAQTWFRYIFDPTRQGNDPVPQRFWIPKPLRGLTSAEILQQQINILLAEVNQGDPDAVAQVNAWRQDPFNPFVLADMRPVAYMKSTVMSYLDNLIAWGDNLFATESREALSEATLIYVIASEILGPAPSAVPPPAHADMSYTQLEPLLDAFANAMVNIENVIGGAGGGGWEGISTQGNLPLPQTFYFTIPPNEQLLGYWDTVADRLYKLRHCQNIAGAPLQLALFDAPIDPGLLIAAQAAGVDLSSVLSDLGASLPNYRFTALYPQALDFVNAVRAYGSSLQAALEKSDAGALALMQQTLQQQLLSDGSDVLDWQVQQAESNLAALNDAWTLAQQKRDFNNNLTEPSNFANVAEWAGLTAKAAGAILKTIAAAMHTTATVAYLLPAGTAGVSGFGGTPQGAFTEGGKNVGDSSKAAGWGMTNWADVLDIAATISTTIGGWQHRQDNAAEAGKEAQTQMDQTQNQINAAQFALQIAQQNQTLHQEQIDNIQKQIDFLNDKFTNNSLYDWMVSSLSATYFQSYQLAYQMCKQVERCYQFELGIENSSFIQFGYWDSLYKGLLAGETLNHDLRRMQSSYLQQNKRRYEMSRYVSLGALNPGALQNLLVNGSCDFTLSESLFDNDYPGHYNRRLTRMSVTVVYPSPGKFDNIKATLTVVSNQVRVKTDVTSGYPESPAGADPRFIYNYAANSQRIVMGNAQDDPGLFITAIASNIADQRYLPFENAGAVSSWHLEMPQINNEVDLSTVGDVVLHLYYTALDGGDGLKSAVQANNLANLPVSGIKIFSAQNDFGAPTATAANPYPLTPWQVFLTAGATQKLTLAISPLKFPAWTRGKTITVSSLTVLAIAWPTTTFVLVPQPPLPTTPITMTPVAGVSEPNLVSATIPTPGTLPATWTFEMQQQGAPDFQSLTKNVIGDVILVVGFDAS
jgi:hypothetical protein